MQMHRARALAVSVAVLTTVLCVQFPSDMSPELDPQDYAPAAGLSDSAIAVSCTAGTDVAAQVFEIWNAGTGTLEYTITDDVTWLECSPSSGSSDDAADIRAVTMQFTTANLAPGTYTATITIGGVASGSVTVTLTVEQRLIPSIGLSTTNLTPRCLTGHNVEASAFEVWNDGTGTLEYTVSADAAWLTLSSAGGTSSGVGDRDTIAVSYATSAMAVGMHTAVIEVSGAGSRTIGVTLVVEEYAVPQIALSDTVLRPACIAGNDASAQVFEVSNAGTGTLAFSITDDSPWLSCTPDSGTSNGAADRRPVAVQYTTNGMAPGAYPAAITVTGVGAGDRVINVLLTITAGAAPAIGLSDTALTVSCVKGENAASWSLDVWNSATGTLTFDVAASPSWLSVSPTSGTSAEAADRTTLTVQFATAALAPGTHTGSIEISGAGTRTIPVSVTVTEAAQPSIAVSDTLLTPSCVEGNNPAAQSFQIWNGGTGTLNFTLTATGTWFSISPTSGASANAADKKTISISYDASALTPGEHTGAITVAAGGADPVDIQLRLTVSAAATPQIGLSRTAITVSCTSGTNPAGQTFQVYNSGTGTLSFTVADDQKWLTCSPTNGTSRGSGDKKTITTTFAAKPLAPGAYTATITVGGAGTRAIDVSLKVLPAAEPAVGVSRTSIIASCIEGKNPGGQTLDVYNAGTGTLSLNLVVDAAWISCTPTSVTSAGSSDKQTITATFRAINLAPGKHTAEINVCGGGADTVVIPVTLYVSPAGKAPFEGGHRMAFAIGYCDSDGDSTDSDCLRWLRGDPRTNEANYWGDLVLDTGFGGTSVPPVVNVDDSQLVVYALTPAQEAQFSATDGIQCVFWQEWGDRDGIYLRPPANCVPDRCGFKDAADGSVYVKAAGGALGIYLNIRITDSLMGADHPYRELVDAVDMYIDQISADEIWNCSCRLDPSHSTLTYTSKRFIVYGGGSGAPDRCAHEYYDEALWSWQTVGLMWDDMKASYGYDAEGIAPSSTVRIIEFFIPWSKLGG